AEARRRALAATNGGALVAGERQGEPLPRIDPSNSPEEVQSPRVRGKTVYFTTSNSTRAPPAGQAARASCVTAPSEPPCPAATAGAAWPVDAGRDVPFIWAGSQGGHWLEDWTGGGLAVDRIVAGVPTAVLTDAARNALATGGRYAAEVGRLKHDAPWARRLIA